MSTGVPSSSTEDTGERPSSRSSLVAALRETVRDAPPTVRVRTADTAGDIMQAAASFAGDGTGRVGAGQLYEPKAEQEQTARISELERQLAKARLQHQQIRSTCMMALSQAKMLQSTLDELFREDGMDAGSREDDDEHDELTGRLGAQIAELEAEAAKYSAELSKVETEAKMLSAELKQRQSAQLRVTQDVQEALVDLVEKHE